MSFLKKILCHILIILGGMFLVFSIINFVNDAMNFMNNEISLVLILIWAILSLVTGFIFVFDMLKKDNAPRAPKQEKPSRRGGAAYESELDQELDTLINVETRHERKKRADSDYDSISSQATIHRRTEPPSPPTLKSLQAPQDIKETAHKSLKPHQGAAFFIRFSPPRALGAYITIPQQAA